MCPSTAASASCSSASMPGRAAPQRGAWPGSAASLPLEVSAGVANAVMMILRIVLGHATQNARAVMLHVSCGALAALCPAAYFLAPRATWRRGRAALVLISRVGIAAMLTLPYDLPAAQPGAGWLSFLSAFLVYSSALPSCFTATAFHVPLRLHLLLAVLQMGAGVPKSLSRCIAPAAGVPAPPSSLLALFPASGFHAIAAALDWPLRLVAPGVWLAAGRMSPAAACLAATFTAQLALGLILPALVLILAARGRGDPSELPLLDAWLGESPWWMAAYTSQFGWLLLRTAAACILPAE